MNNLWSTEQFAITVGYCHPNDPNESKIEPDSHAAYFRKVMLGGERRISSSLTKRYT